MSATDILAALAADPNVSPEFAAAPELLDIAQRVERMLTAAGWLTTSDAPESALLRDARAAIAAATGSGE